MSRQTVIRRIVHIQGKRREAPIITRFHSLTQAALGAREGLAHTLADRFGDFRRVMHFEIRGAGGQPCGADAAGIGPTRVMTSHGMPRVLPATNPTPRFVWRADAAARALPWRPIKHAGCASSTHAAARAFVRSCLLAHRSRG